MGFLSRISNARHGINFKNPSTQTNKNDGARTVEFEGRPVKIGKLRTKSREKPSGFSGKIQSFIKNKNFSIKNIKSNNIFTMPKVNFGDSNKTIFVNHMRDLADEYSEDEVMNVLKSGDFEELFNNTNIEKMSYEEIISQAFKTYGDSFENLERVYQGVDDALHLNKTLKSLD